MSPHVLLSALLCLSGQAMEQLRNAAGNPSYGPVPVSDPVCVEPCSQAQPSQQSGETPQQRAARAAAAAEAQRRAEAAARAARAESDAAERALQSLSLEGARLREAAERYQQQERRDIDRETRAGSLRPEMAPVAPPTSATTVAPRPSLEDYVRKLNEEARARERGLRVAAPPPLPPTPPSPAPPPLAPIAPTSVAAFETPPRVGQDTVRAVLADFSRLRAAAKEVADDLGWKQLWYLAEKFAPGIQTMGTVVEDHRAYFKALATMNQRLMEGTFSQAQQVAWSLGSRASRPSVTDEDNTALLQRQRGDVNDTTGKLLGDKVTDAAFGAFIEGSNGWLGARSRASLVEGGGE